MTGKSEYPPNRLIHEKSPYLLQHAHNPVDWRSWGDEAFADARRENRPVFLSIGYATCHWCHVMERESFENESIAKMLNNAFICIKVDREERPDIDHIYMTACQLMTGQGGWPLTIFMTPEGLPFFAGTYFPPEARYGRPGLQEIVPRLRELWDENPSEIARISQSIGAHVMAHFGATTGAEPDPRAAEATLRELQHSFDPAFGGFGTQPKFPMPHQISFLLRHYARSGNPHALLMAQATLDGMMNGGIHDHLGGGFHRYSTDRRWLVPHFEKMLYDQALCATAFLEAFQVTGVTSYACTAENIFEYVLRDLADSGGAFYSAEDADSEGEEGRFYVWTMRQIEEILGHSDADLASAAYGAAGTGNFAEEASGRLAGSNILHRPRPLDDIACKQSRTPEEASARMEILRRKLFEARAGRPRPHRDEKILADWNGLMIAALALGARVLKQPEFAEDATRACHFILTRMTAPDGRLLHRYCCGEAAIPAQLDDYAFMIWGLLNLYQADFRPEHLQEAVRLCDICLHDFEDAEAGGFFMTAKDAAGDLIARPREWHDGAQPSGNSVMLHNLANLAALTGAVRFETAARRLLSTAAPLLNQAPTAHSWLISGAELLFRGVTTVTVAGKRNDKDTLALTGVSGTLYLPGVLFILRDPDEPGSCLEELCLPARGKQMIGGKATAYVCREGACLEPVFTMEALSSILAPEN
ncbi:MAG TPA: thioredoxin domain-containing protein [Candidatus Sumerlaeota bacterium]|nr:thioredoxin domain-containing protein [Candidatus Sumerlaeota bacterium]